ncbi:MAG: hypothetical protein ABIF87_13580 [Pseudomonadota bacterium]
MPQGWPNGNISFGKRLAGMRDGLKKLGLHWKEGRMNTTIYWFDHGEDG